MKVVVEPASAAVMNPQPAINGHDVFRAPDPERATHARLREELDTYYDEIQNYRALEPDQVLLSVSGIAARLVAIRAELQRSNSQRSTRLRTTEIDPLLDHLEMQMRIHSRLVTTRQFDWEVSGKGQT